ncbi:zinc-dependent alcohol dehydrogenase family protein [Kordiimonas marina]|uniref:zinc-dependent alcohol dehydrogenase family protein n=1 Tax=Kordiimonas marina TaxID=2872312 RepID=UPI001FF181A4|nr:zinc-dependent alcohol dehydrogenase family protein [Kordiimonas marina]MCJ9427913.1 zinc-dependent alcohol dehydrogenase family protein [Kordiimonas marina]
MKAVLYEAFSKPPHLTTVPDPTPEPHGVVVQVMATGVCRSDWHGWKGHDPDITLPHVPGHELAGTVAAVGRDVTCWRVGDRVTMPFVAGCGHCPQCHAGHQQVCDHQFQPGFTHWGSFAEYVSLHQADLNLVRLPDSMDFTTAASLGCRFVTSFRAVVDQGRAKAGEWVAVHGAGGVGLSAIMIAQAQGAQVVAVDISEEKLALARTLGALVTVNAAETDDVPAAIRAATHGGAHLSIDALGHPATCYNSVSCLRKRGRHVQVGLMVDDYKDAKIPMSRVLADELEILGSHGMQAHRYDAMLAMIEAGSLKPERLIGRTISLEQAAEALTTMDTATDPGVTVITEF